MDFCCNYYYKGANRLLCGKKSANYTFMLKIVSLFFDSTTRHNGAMIPVHHGHCKVIAPSTSVKYTFSAKGSAGAGRGEVRRSLWRVRSGEARGGEGGHPGGAWATRPAEPSAAPRGAAGVSAHAQYPALKGSGAALGFGERGLKAGGQCAAAVGLLKPAGGAIGIVGVRAAVDLGNAGVAGLPH